MKRVVREKSRKDKVVGKPLEWKGEEVYGRKWRRRKSRRKSRRKWRYEAVSDAFSAPKFSSSSHAPEANACGGRRERCSGLQVLSLPALLVQKYKY
jgi:hypothetical protein